MTGKTALITGITGQDGAYLAKFLLSKGYSVFGTSRSTQTRASGNLEIVGIENDVALVTVNPLDFLSVTAVVDKVRPDEIYNLSAQSSVGRSFDIPLQTIESISGGTLNILEAVRQADHPIKLYSAGSSECFGNTDGVPASEATIFQPQSPYAVAKVSAFFEVKNYREAYGLFACTGITFNHESPLRPPQYVTRKIVQSAVQISRGEGHELRLGNLTIERDWGWAPEYVCAMWAMLQQQSPEDYVLATGESNKLEDFVDAAFGQLDLDWRNHVVKDSGLIRPKDFALSRADPTNAQKKLGWKATSRMRDVVSKMIEAELSMRGP